MRKFIFFLVLLAVTVAAVPVVNAEVACLNPLQITNSSDHKALLRFDGNNLAWYNSTTSQIQLYDIATQSITSIPATLAEGFNELILNGDNIAWVDHNRQLQLYKISTKTTTALTAGSRPSSELKITDNWVVWKTQYDDPRVHDLFAYNITTAETFRVVKNKSFSYLLHGGQVFWATGGITEIKTRQYELAAKSQTVIADQLAYVLRAVNENYMVWVDYVTSELVMINRLTGVSTVIYTYPFRTLIDEVEIQGDYVVWDQYTGLAPEKAVFAYQISTGKTIPVAPYYDYTRGDLVIDERFIAYHEGVGPTEHNKYFVSDLLSGSLTPMTTAQFPFSHELELDNNRIAWMGNQGWDNVTGLPLNPQVFLYNNCGSTPEIITQSQDLGVLAGRTVTLSVEALGDEIITYQWYQGASGDTSTPLNGANLSTFTTPTITTPTSYWVRLTNMFGATDSETITLTPGTNAELVKDGGFEDLNSGVWRYQAAVPAGIKAPVCNTETKTFSHTGQCALRLIAANAYLPRAASQSLDVSGLLTGDTLTLSLWARMKNADAPTKAILKITYQNGTTGQVVIKVPKGKLPYTTFTKNITVAAPVSEMTLVIKNRGLAGASFIDDVSVIQTGAN